ncbi:MAG: double zinc ribbon domain-containing protein [bacterium]
MTDLLRRALQVLYPGVCLLCGRPPTGGVSGAAFAPVCGSCRRLLTPVDAPKRCRICSAPLISEHAVCTRCRARSFHFSSSFSLFEYADAVRELIYQLKFANRRSLVPLLAGLLEPVVSASFQGRTVFSGFGCSCSGPPRKRRDARVYTSGIG